MSITRKNGKEMNTPNTMSNDPLYHAKVNKVLDLIRRACVNGRQREREVALAIVDDWQPAMEINEQGYVFFPTLDNVTVKQTPE